MRINNIESRLSMESSYLRSNPTNYIKARQKYLDAAYSVDTKNTLNSSSAIRVNQSLRDLGLF